MPFTNRKNCASKGQQEKKLKRIIEMKPVIILGGGIAGLIASVTLARKGIESIVFEKKDYPGHKVCGEYISNEALPFLKSVNLFPKHIALPQISRFQLSSVQGRSEYLRLKLGGFGISRYAFDSFLYAQALEAGVQVNVNSTVDEIFFANDLFTVRTKSGEYNSSIVLGAFGKRSNIDVKLNRDFIKKRSPYVGVKYHLKVDLPEDLISLHNFNGGYCGVSPVENKIVNLCYLCHRDKVRQFKSLENLERQALSENPHLKQIFSSATFLFDKPETINEINFENKRPVENHILMIGDAAGLITPLCGNGMAMAIHSAKIAAEIVSAYVKQNGTRDKLENEYARQWNSTFRDRLWAGRQIQRLFGSEEASSLAINLAVHIPPLANFIVRNTHGKPF
jgi:menaquinone-9 beta-reductase